MAHSSGSSAATPAEEGPLDVEEYFEDLVGCGACERVFPTDLALREHRLATWHFFECRTCVTEYWEYDTLFAHFAASGHGCFRCPGCDAFWTPQLDVLVEHLADAHPKAPTLPLPLRLADVKTPKMPDKPRAYYSNLQANGQKRETLFFNR
jgi:hypothetical protein